MFVRKSSVDKIATRKSSIGAVERLAPKKNSLQSVENIETSPAQKANTYYTKRRSMASNPRSSLSLPLSPPKDDPISTSGQSILQVDLTAKPREELMRMCARHHAELSLKNKLIHDLKNSSNYTYALAQSTPVDHSERLDELARRGITAAEDEEAKVNLFQTLLSFKKTLVSSRATWEESTARVKVLEGEKSALEAETTHLKSLLKIEVDSEQLVIERKRVEELERELMLANKELGSINAKVDLWARSSKRNQEARVIAESSLRTVETELSFIKSVPMTVGLTKSDTLDSTQTLVESPLHSTFSEKNGELQAAAARVAELELALSEISETVGDFERENTELEIMNETLKTQLAASNQRLVKAESNSILLDLQEKYDALEREKIDADTAKTNVALALTQAQQELKLCEARRELSDEETSRLSISVMELKVAKNEATDQNEMIESSLRIARDKIDSLSRELASLETIKDEKRGFESEIVALKASLDELKSVNTSTSSIAELERNLRDAEAREKTILEQIITDRESASQSSAADISTLQSELLALNTRVTQLDELRTELKETNELVNAMEVCSTLSNPIVRIRNCKTTSAAVDN